MGFFRVRRQKWCLSLQVRSFSAENRLQTSCSEFRFLPRKACEFQPAELVTACHRFVTARFLGAKVRKSGPSSGPRSPQGFPRSDSPPRTRPRSPTARRGGPSAVQKALKTLESEESVFPCRTASGMAEPQVSLVFGRKRAPHNHFAQVSAFGPENRRIPVRRRAENCAKGLEKQNQLRGFGPTSLWCGPGAGLGSVQDCPFNPALAIGLPLQSCAGNRIAPSILRWQHPFLR